MRERPILFSGPMIRAILEGRKTQTRRVAKPIVGEIREAHGLPGYRLCPYGVPGDWLWVRETWQHNPFGGIVYREGSGIIDCDGRGWHPSIFMPRWASRITLELMSVRVQRVQEISAADCIAEGVTYIGCNDADMDACDHAEAAKDAYRDLWDSLNAKRGFGWDANPWVWVLTFKRIGEEKKP